jgi:hypothetical protein
VSAADRGAVCDLLVGYFRGFDERRTDDAFLMETFTADAHWRFPRGDATGIEEIIERRDGTLGLWQQTLHSVSSVLIELDGDRRRFTATLLATHIHRDGRLEIRSNRGRPNRRPTQSCDSRRGEDESDRAEPGLGSSRGCGLTAPCGAATMRL